MYICGIKSLNKKNMTPEEFVQKFKIGDAAELKSYFKSKPTSKVDSIEVNEIGQVIEVNYRCTDNLCSCVGYWSTQTENKPYGKTIVVSNQ